MRTKWFGRAALAAMLMLVFVVGGPETGAADLGQETGDLASLNDALAAPRPEGSEIPELRTRTSKTFAAGRGSFRAELYQGSVNYRDAAGEWQPVENELVPATDTGYAFRNKANRFAVDLPLLLGSAPVRVRVGDRWLTFALAGARGVAATSGASARYVEALPGVTVAYSSFGDGVKEELVLAGPSSPSRFSFAVEASAGLSATRTAAGGIEFVDASGERVFEFAPPSMEDASGAFSDGVALTLTEAESGWTVELVANRAWLEDPARRWPVKIDPTTFVGPSLETSRLPALDCYIDAGTPSGDCTATKLEVGSDGNGAGRALLRFDVDSLPRGSQVLYGGLSLSLRDATGSPAAIGLHRVARAQLWTSGVTWSTYDGTNNWTNVGGDFVSPAYDQITVSGAAGSAHYFELTEIVQDWVEDVPLGLGQPANQGILLKAVDESSVNPVRFRSFEYFMGITPLLNITYKPRTGQLRQYSFGDELNVVNGNVFLAEQDLAINGAGLDLEVNRFYNRLDTSYIGAFGRGWTMGPGSRCRP